jgi:hypothetical protein
MEFIMKKSISLLASCMLAFSLSLSAAEEVVTEDASTLLITAEEEVSDEVSALFVSTEEIPAETSALLACKKCDE